MQCFFSSFSGSFIKHVLTSPNKCIVNWDLPLSNFWVPWVHILFYPNTRHYFLFKSICISFRILKSSCNCKKTFVWSSLSCSSMLWMLLCSGLNTHSCNVATLKWLLCVVVMLLHWPDEVYPRTKPSFTLKTKSQHSLTLACLPF